MQVMLTGRTGSINWPPVGLIGVILRMQNDGLFGAAPIALHALELQLVALRAAWIGSAAVYGP